MVRYTSDPVTNGPMASGPVTDGSVTSGPMINGPVTNGTETNGLVTRSLMTNGPRPIYITLHKPTMTTTSRGFSADIPNTYKKLIFFATPVRFCRKNKWMDGWTNGWIN